MNLNSGFANGEILNPFSGELQKVETFDPMAAAVDNTNAPTNGPITVNEPVPVNNETQTNDNVAANAPIDPSMAFFQAFNSDGGFDVEHDEGDAVASADEVTVVNGSEMSNVINTEVNEENVFRGTAVPTDMGIVTVSAASELIESSAFNATLAKIPVTAELVNSLLKEYRDDPFTFIKTHDEKELDELVKEIGEINQFVNGVKNKRKDIKAYFDSVRDEALTHLDKKLDDAQFSTLTDAQADIRLLKNDISAQRINQRWQELEETFKANLAQYPLIATMSPSLQDFSRFKLLNANMVSGAKSKKVTKKMHAQVNDIMFGWNTGLESIRTNVWGLNDVNLMNLLREFESDPSVQKVTEKGAALKHKQDAEIEAARQREELLKRQAEEEKIRRENYERQQAQLAEQARIAELQKSKQQAEEIAREQQRLELEQQQAIAMEQQRRAEIERITNQYVPPMMKQSYPTVMEYVFANPSFRQLHGNDRVKAAVVYDLVQQMGQPNSPVAVDTQLDPTKVLNLVRFIMDA